MDYFKNKQTNKVKALAHFQKMEEEYLEEIKYSSDNTSFYNVEFNNKESLFQKLEKPKFKVSLTPTIIVEENDSVSAIFKHEADCVLNFASYKNPGGMFIEGSSAQEEALCHKSTLYNVLLRQQSYFYNPNRQNLNKGLYTDKALYSPSILFIDNDKKLLCDVITCAAPNFSLYKYGKYTKEENRTCLENRIRLVVATIKRNKPHKIVLGAFGCGVFKQDPYEVARLFKKYLKDFDYNAEIIFAIPAGINLEAFKEVFNNEI